MGEIADAMINGEMCEWWGTMFEKEHGYPVLCDSCWEDATKKEREGHQHATEKKYNDRRRKEISKRAAGK